MNPYTSRYENNLYYILSEKSADMLVLPEVKDQVLIVLNLYYMDTLSRYLSYLDRIPKEIQVIVVSSSEAVLLQTREYINKNGLVNVRLFDKENRGRDISALLVACRMEILKYKYFCFVHDKKSGLETIDEETDLWIENLWNNTIINENYILNVLNLFEDHKEIGLLVPPEPIGETRAHWFSNNWGKNFELAQSVLEGLGINSDLDANIPVMTLGTALWGRTEALHKLFEYDWKYEDFMVEPMPIDGSISHAIERILAFVAQDAKYMTGTIMCTSYAEKLLGILQKNMFEMFSILKRTTSFSINNLREMSRYFKLESFYNKYENVYLYGAGAIGEKCLHFMRAIKCEPKGFIVSEKMTCESVKGVTIKTIEEVIDQKDLGIIITVSKKYIPEIESILKEKQITNYICFLEMV